MKGEERRKQLLNILSSSNNPVSGGTLSKELNVSRQIIVQDISLLRANGATIFSTNKGYLLVCDESYLLPCRAFVKHVLGRVDGGKQMTSILIIAVGGGVQPNRAYSTG